MSLAIACRNASISQNRPIAARGWPAPCSNVARRLPISPRTEVPHSAEPGLHIPDSYLHGLAAPPSDLQEAAAWEGTERRRQLQRRHITLQCKHAFLIRRPASGIDCKLSTPRRLRTDIAQPLCKFLMHYLAPLLGREILACRQHKLCKKPCREGKPLLHNGTSLCKTIHTQPHMCAQHMHTHTHYTVTGGGQVGYVCVFERKFATRSDSSAQPPGFAYNAEAACRLPPSIRAIGCEVIRALSVSTRPRQPFAQRIQLTKARLSWLHERTCIFA